MRRNPAAAFGSAERKKADKGLKRSGASRSGVAGARKKKQNAAKRAKQTAADTFQRLELLKASGKKLTKAQEAAHRKHEAAFLASRGHDAASARLAAKEHTQRLKAIGRILGPSGMAQAVKISKATGEPFKASDLAAWRSAGWGIEAAGSVAGRVGAGGLPGVVIRPEDWPSRNPDPLGAGGLARAVVLVGRVDESLLLDLVADGFDVAPAPRRLREPQRNPSPDPAQKKVYDAMKAAANKGQALRVDELAERIKGSLGPVADAVEKLIRAGLAHEAGRDLFGPCYLPGVPQQSLFNNPTPGRKAEKKAAAWYQMESLESGARTIKLPDTVEAVEVGEIVAIEYRSRKYTGHEKTWRHDVTGKRTLHISTDGKVMVILPGFKITKRGIEG